MRIHLTVCAVITTLAACTSNPERIVIEKKNGITVANLIADYETSPVDSEGDAADDPAFWLNEADPSLSLVLGTNKQLGLLVYNLEGDLLQSLATGRVNNVDVRRAQNIQNDKYDIAVASNRSNNTLSIYLISSEAQVSHLGEHPLTLTEPYGSCMYSDSKNRTHVLVNDKNGSYQQWLIESLQPLKLSLQREFSVATQPEGCAVDDATGTLFLGEEERGIWKLDLGEPDSKPILLTTIEDSALVADVEGMDIYVGGKTNYLIVSSQGDNSFAVYDIGKHADNFVYRGSFRIVLDKTIGIDGAQETDGLTVSSARLNSVFPEGIVIVQDGYNRNPNQAQNFKLISWKKIQNSLRLQ